ncbi:GNAT family N-acetyltransferase [Paraflavitalea pollutisoli]|uniref:GNAT family N-acetyltransferase n=1 Tax=Paraflavitalea pollutisoli TaxID=3034143 RepID=UPI0023EA8A6C|nr:GNAT family N-acetyltransferase [Paraflavitalea sp. H1-2-19X]
MNASVYIRPLVVQDALVSYQWRNNPRIWRFTGARPDKYITPEMETAWVYEVLQRENEKRFAICLHMDNKYIGNIFLTDIQNNEAQMHIFIGEMEYWGKRRAFEAICMIFDFAFNEQGLDQIYVQINSRNSAALVLGKLAGFKKVSEYYDTNKEMMLEKMIFSRAMYNQQLHLKDAGKEIDQL